METSTEERVESIVKLFVDWRKKQDNQIGQNMASRFERWFESVTVANCGINKQQSQLLRQVCTNFSAQLQNIRSDNDLVPTAYSILQKELQQYSASKIFEMKEDISINEILQQVWGNLQSKEQSLLLQVYAKHQRPLPDQLYALLEARYKLKNLIFQRYFAGDHTWVLPETPNRDLLPMPLYEANILQNKPENQYFECWLINAPLVCLDIQEFAPFAHALFNGAIAEKVATPVATNTTPIDTKSTDDGASEIPKEKVSEHLQDMPPIPHNTTDVNSIMKPVIVGIILIAVLSGVYFLIGG